MPVSVPQVLTPRGQFVAAAVLWIGHTGKAARSSAKTESIWREVLEEVR
jgi:hypothetical protein